MMFSFAIWNPSEVANIPLSCSDTDTNMQYIWTEDESGGVIQLQGLSVPKDNREYTMYHGTSSAIAQSIQATGFRPSPDGMLGRGVYLSRELQKASRYPDKHPEHDRVVIKCLVKVGKVIKIDYLGHPMRKTWHDHGFDTAWVPPDCGVVKSGSEDCVWDPPRITILQIIKPITIPVQTVHVHCKNCCFGET